MWLLQKSAFHLQCQKRWASVAGKVPPEGCRNGWCCQMLWSRLLSASLQEAWGTNVVSDRALLYVRVFTATDNVGILWKAFWQQPLTDPASFIYARSKRQINISDLCVHQLILYKTNSPPTLNRSENWVFSFNVFISKILLHIRINVVQHRLTELLQVARLHCIVGNIQDKQINSRLWWPQLGKKNIQIKKNIYYHIQGHLF